MLKKLSFLFRYSYMLFIILMLSVMSGCSAMSSSAQRELSGEFQELQLDKFEEAHGKDLNSSAYRKYEDRVTIGFAMDSLKEERWKKDRGFFIEKAKQLNADVRIKEANGDDRLQLSQVDALIAEGVNIIVVVPVSGENAAEIVKKAHEARIKVVSYDRLVKNSALDYYVSFDNEKVGQIQASAMLRVVPKGEIAYVGGAPTDNNAILFRKGAIDSLSEQIDSSNIQLVMDKYSTDWKPSEAYANVKELLKQKGSSLKGIIAANDGTASGAIAALKEAGLEGKVFVTGQDADLAAAQRIAAGTQLMTVYKPVQLIAQTAAEVAVKAAKGETIQTTGTISNGYGEIPSILLEPVEVTKDNLKETVIQDGFHKEADVYKK